MLDIGKLSYVVPESFHFAKKLYISTFCMFAISLATTF
jgi:hypothetical protein